MRSAADCCVRGRFSCCTTDGAHRQWPSGRQSNVWHSNVRQFCGCTLSCYYTGTHSRHVKPCGDVANQQVMASLKCSRNSLHLNNFLPPSSSFSFHLHYRFLGIPYAKPPVGDLRWRPPQQHPAWEGVRDTTQYGDACPQMGSTMVGGRWVCAPSVFM